VEEAKIENSLEARIGTLAQWVADAEHLVAFTGAGISTESGLPDYRGPDGLWTRRDKGLPAPKFDWSSAEPNESHMMIAELQGMGKLSFLISQNIDNLHLKSGIEPDLIAELHGNVANLKCRGCGFKCDRFPDLVTCPLCGGKLASSVVNFGDPMPVDEVEKAMWHSQHCDLFIVVGSSLVVYPAADMPRIACEYGAKLVILNQGETPLDRTCHLRFEEEIGDVLPPTMARLKTLLE
jgi:NAD-dependent SIR2 family protein deacetylase